MRIAFIGAGGVGGYFGGRIAAAGGEVVFVARGHQGEALKAKGLEIRSDLGDARVTPVDVVERVADVGRVDLVIVAVKLWDTEQVAQDLVPLARAGAAVLSLQNGVAKDEVLGSALPDGALLGGVCYISAAIEEPGVIRHSGTLQRIAFGEFDGSESPRSKGFLEACRAGGIDVEMVPEVAKLIWAKFVFLVGLSAVTCAVRQPIGVVRGDATSRALLRNVMCEAASVARARGVDLDEAFVDERMAFVDTLPASMVASMRHDLDRGNRLELPWLSGDVVRLARTLGVGAPVNEALLGVLSPYASGRVDTPSEGAAP